jgi:hypothetical protein
VLKEKDDRDIFVMAGDASVHLLAEGLLVDWVDDLNNPELYFDYYRSHEERAKRVYFRHTGNFYGASLGEYAHYRVPREKELIWDAELKQIAEEKARELNIARAKKRSHQLLKHNAIALLVGTAIAVPLVWAAFVFFIYPYLDEAVLQRLLFADVLLGGVAENPKANLATLLIGIGLIFVAASVVIFAFQRIEKNKRTIRN